MCHGATKRRPRGKSRVDVNWITVAAGRGARPRREGAEGGRVLQCRVEPDRDRRQALVLDRQPAPAPAAARSQVDEHEHDRGCHHGQGGDGVQPQDLAEQPERRHGRALVAAGDRHPAADHLAADQGQRQRQDRQVEHLEAAGGDADHEADRRRQGHRQQGDQGQRQAAAAEVGGGVGADGHEGHVADRPDSAQTGQLADTEGDDREHRDRGDHEVLVAVGQAEGPDREQGRDAQGHCRQQPPVTAQQRAHGDA